MSSERIKKLNDLFRDEVARIFSKEVDISEDALVTVVGAEVSPTLEHATIRISVFPKNKSEAVIEKIEKQIYQIQQLLNKHLVMRPVPKIRFEIDSSGDRADKIEKIFSEIE